MCDEGRLSYKRYQGEGRLLQPVKRGQGDWQPIDWKQCRADLEQVFDHTDGAIGGIVSAKSTNEEIFLFRRLIERTDGGRVAGHSWSPADALRDEFLIDADKNPNTAGLRAQGLDPAGARQLIDAALNGELAVLIAFRTDLSEICTSEEMDRLGDVLQQVIVLDTHYGPSVEIADLVAPIASFAATAGSFVNRRGRVQRIGRAVAPAGNSHPGWELLGELIDRKPAGPDHSAAAVFDALSAESPSFEGLSFAALGERGAQLAAFSIDGSE